MRAAAALVVALAAGAALFVLAPDDDPPAPPPGRTSLAAAWPHAATADLPGLLLTPALFLDARTVVGTRPTPDGAQLRLMRGATELRRRPVAGAPVFDNLAVHGDALVWSESADGTATGIWAADLRTNRTRRLTADAGDVLFFGSRHDLSIHDGRVSWATAAGAGATAVRTVALTGGPVSTRVEPGSWQMSAWPWLTGEGALRNLETGKDVAVAAGGTELATCGPVWCRVMVTGAGGLVRIDVMHPDGTARQRVAGPAAGAALPDAAVLDRFEVLTEPQPNSAVTGTEGLLVHDITTKRTVDLSVAATAVHCRGTVLFWSTGDSPETTVWHTLDLATV